MVQNFIYWKWRNGMGYWNSWSTVIILTLFRLVAVGGIVLVVGFSRKKRQFKYLIVVALRLCSAFGNIIDSVFLRCNFDLLCHSLHCFVNSLIGSYFHDVVDIFYFLLLVSKSNQLPNHLYIFLMPSNVNDMANFDRCRISIFSKESVPTLN
jgi:lipoprotein signal peptidase